MTDSEELIGVFDKRVQRRDDRRALFKAILGAGVVGAGLAMAGSAEAQAVTDGDILNFALNLEYLESNFYYYAAFGTPIPATSITGTGTAVSTATAADSTGALYNAGARQVKFSDPSVQAYANEIAADELNHVNFLRKAIGATAVAQPVLDVGITPNGAFSTAARAAGLIGATSATAPTFFDVYANDLSFLYGAFIFEDVGVTAYRGASGLLTNKTYLDAAAGILAVEAYHAAIVRTTLDQLGVATPIIRTNTEAISNVRDAVDGTTDDDQGIAQIANTVGTLSNIAPTDGNGLAYGRTTGQVLNIVYLNSPPTKVGATKGGFFPAGMNGNITTSTPNG
ncbi:ferritin-like domain-containing protein [Sphingomonas bacterium]|uniref:ferritin-like domain-containing protein n=1 Tax=Sphingomonas bacterium TaxID=1895847 RepID=UPI001576508B|nr:ferritin-like domain-containing protein [Sphingomonas bacterium]